MMSRSSLRAAKFFSALFNPLFIPIFGIGWILYLSHAPEMLIMHPLLKRLILVITLVFSTLLPLMTIVLMKIFGLTNHMELPRRKDRLMPILLSVGYSIFGFVFLIKIPNLNPFFFLLPLGSAAVLLVTFFCTMRFQISLHMAAIGALTGTFLVSGYLLGPYFLLPLLFSILIAGCTGFARIALNAHKPYQVYSGYLTGLVTQSISVLALNYLLT